MLAIFMVWCYLSRRHLPREVRGQQCRDGLWTGERLEFAWNSATVGAAGAVSKNMSAN